MASPLFRESRLDAASLAPIRLEPRFVERVWGGDRFPAGDQPIGEVWLVHESNLVSAGPGVGATLADVVEEYGSQVLGEMLWHDGERSFPLLVKLIDAREWLSIQVHPTDDLAEMLEGPGHRGKSEAWYGLDASPDAEIIAGIRAEVTQHDLEESIQNGTIESILVRHSFGRDDVIALPAGTVHALGPGTFIYEIQQSSDITYRVYDWQRPPGAGRELHLEKSVAAANVELRPQPRTIPRNARDALTPLVELPQFTLRRAEIADAPLRLETRGEAFHLVTMISGKATLECGEHRSELSSYETLLIPAASPAYVLTPIEPSALLIASPR